MPVGSIGPEPTAAKQIHHASERAERPIVANPSWAMVSRGRGPRAAALPPPAARLGMVRLQASVCGDGQDGCDLDARSAGAGADLLSGTVTFLLTDIEGSTRLWETVPDAMEVG
jgi:hypothetical protein